MTSYENRQFLAQLSLGKSLIYYVHNFYNLGYAFGIVKPTLNQYILTITVLIIFLSFGFKKTKSFFSFKIIAIRSSAFSLKHVKRQADQTGP